MQHLEERLAELEHAGLRRRLRLISGPQGPRVLLDGKPVLLLCSNNYLSLADHPRVREAAAEAAMRWGVGAGASRLVCGSMTIHRRLEEQLAGFKRTEACVLFGSGYLANLGVVGALARAHDAIFSDELNHASIVDACRLAKAPTVVYRHCDPEHLEWCLHRHRPEGEPLIVTDTVFSMDGHLAPLPELAELAERHGARLIVDEAHATGALGPGGRGAVAAAGLEGAVDVIVGTLGKALGSYGAYACATQATVQYLISSARSLIFSTAPAPPAVAGALASLELLQERPQRVERLRLAARVLRDALHAQGFAVPPGEMHIVPLVVGDPRDALRLSQAAIERGVFAQAIRPPSVPAATARLRLTVMASHSAQELRGAARALARAAREQGMDPAQIGCPEAAQGPAHAAGASSDPPWAREHPARSLTVVAAGPREPYDGAFADEPTQIAAPAAPDPSLAGRELPETAELDVLAGQDQPAAPPQTRGPFDLEREGGLREAA